MNGTMFMTSFLYLVKGKTPLILNLLFKIILCWNTKIKALRILYVLKLFQLINILSGFLCCLVNEGEAYQFELCCCHLHFVNDESNFNKQSFPLSARLPSALRPQRYLSILSILSNWKSRTVTCLPYWNAIIDLRFVISHPKGTCIN